jgi:hypothetical protein
MNKALNLTIKRLNISNEYETISEVYLDDEFFCFAIEQPWNDNTPFASCIPTGVYNLVNHSSKKYGEVYALINPIMGITHYKSETIKNNRYAILIHAANWAHELMGCIAPGDAFIIDKDGRGMVTNSKKTLEKLFSRIDKNTQVIIKNEGDWE